MVTLSGHKEAVTGLDWSNNPSEIVTVGWDQSIIIWDLELAGKYCLGALKSRNMTGVHPWVESHYGPPSSIN